MNQLSLLAGILLFLGSQAAMAKDFPKCSQASEIVQNQNLEANFKKFSADPQQKREELFLLGEIEEILLEHVIGKEEVVTDFIFCYPEAKDKPEIDNDVDTNRVLRVHEIDFQGYPFKVFILKRHSSTRVFKVALSQVYAQLEAPEAARESFVVAALEAIYEHITIISRSTDPEDSNVPSEPEIISRRRSKIVAQPVNSEVRDNFLNDDDDDDGKESLGDGKRSLEGTGNSIRVFYGTNRNQVRTDDVKKMYGAERTFQMKYGWSNIHIPKDHKVGTLDKKGIWSKIISFNLDDTVHISHIKTLNSAQFFSQIRRNEVSQPDVGFVFVHGFNVPFYDAIRVAGQMTFDMGFNGTPILFSWPSAGELGKYVADQNSARTSKSLLRKFLSDLKKQNLGGFKTIHVIAHSMGNLATTTALASYGAKMVAAQRPLVDRVVLAAPDVDLMEFQVDLVDDLLKAAREVTVYCHNYDLALYASSKEVLNKYPRLGQCKKNPFVQGVTTVNATPSDKRSYSVALNHSYFSEDIRMLTEIRRYLLGRPPSSRDLIKKHSPQSHWSLYRDPYAYD